MPATATLDLIAKDSRYRGVLNRAMSVTERLRAQMQRVAAASRRMLLVGGAAIGGFLKLAAEQERQEAKLTAVIRSTGMAAGFTAEQLFKQASALQAITGTGDETIIAMQAVLATFKKIKGDNFIAAQAAILDMAAVLETDLKSAAIQVGKALNDPIKGISALSRSGITFTAEQVNLIKTLVQTGNAVQAQAVIIAELNSEFGGAAKAIGDTFHGAVKKAWSAIGDLGETIGNVFMPAMKDFALWVVTTKDDINDWVVANQAAIKTVTSVTFALIAATVAADLMLKAITALTLGMKAFQIASLWLIKHPIVAAVALLAGGLVYLYGVVNSNIRKMKELEKGTDAYADSTKDAKDAVESLAKAEGSRHDKEMTRRAKRDAARESKVLDMVIKEMQRIKEEIVTFGLEGDEKTDAKLRFRGALPEDLKRLRKDRERLSLLKEQAALEQAGTKAAKEKVRALNQEAEQVLELIKTDEQRLEAELARLGVLQKAGKLTAKEVAAREAQLTTEDTGGVARFENVDVMIRRISEAAGGRKQGAFSPASQTATATKSTAKNTESTARDTRDTATTLRDILDFLQDAINQRLGAAFS